MTTDVQCGFCYSLNILSNISDIEWRDLENIPEEEYDHKIEQILKSKEISFEKEIKKNEEKKKKEKSLNENSKYHFEFPNIPVKWGLFFTLLSILMGDILNIIEVGYVFQQTALSIGFGMFGLGLILFGSFGSVILRLDKIIDDKGSD